MTPRGGGVGGNDSRDPRESILSAAEKLLATEGLDALSLPRLAGLAGVSTGPVYNRWDGGEDIALELWEAQYSAHFEHILGILDAAMSLDGSRAAPATVELVGELTEPFTATLAVTEILLAFRRFPWLSASIGPGVDRAFADYVNADAQQVPALRYGQLNAVFGTLALGSLLTGLPVDWVGVLGSLRAATTGPRPVGAFGPGDADNDVHHLPPPRVKTGNPIMDRFLAATYTVTARSGYEKASAHRISRVAGLAFSHVYNHFDTKEELTRHAAKVLIDEFRFLAVRALHVHDRAEYTLNVMRVMRGLWDEESLSASRLRAEIILAARHHGPLGDTMREGFIETWRTTVANLPDGVAPTAAYMNLLICINGLGMSLLALAFPSGRNLDMTPIASEWGRAMDALRRDMGIPPTTGSA